MAQPTIHIGVPGLIPPLVLKIGNKGQVTGFDIDLMNALCKRINYQCHYKTLPFEAVLPAVESHQVDVGIGDFTITPDTHGKYIFSIPYLPSYAQFVVLNSSPLQNIESLKNKKIGARLEAVFAPLIKRLFGQQIIFEGFHSGGDLFSALVDNKIDAIILESASAKSIVANLTNLRLLGKPISHGMGYGIAAHPSQHLLIKKLNQALLEIQSDGTYTNIYNKYFVIN